MPDAIRVDTPGARNGIFLDSAGSSLTTTPVLDEVISHLRRESEVGGYRAATERAADLEEGYAVFADLLGCRADEVAFTESATRSWLALADAVPLQAGDRILISELEYGANAVALLRLSERVGARIEVVPSDDAGVISLEALERMLDEQVKLVSLVHVPSHSGAVNPVREVAEAAHRVGALVLLDACQSVGQLPVRVDELGVDLLSGTGRKWLRGPRGTGFLVARRGVADRLWPRLVDHTGASWLDGMSYRLRDDARVFEVFESGVAQRLGLIAAARYALELGVDSIAAMIAELADRLRAGLADIDGVEVRDTGRQRCGIVTFTVRGHDARELAATLGRLGITVAVSGIGSARLDMGRRGLEAVVRASPHYFVTPAEIDEALRVVSACARR